MQCVRVWRQGMVDEACATVGSRRPRARLQFVMSGSNSYDVDTAGNTRATRYAGRRSDLIAVDVRCRTGAHLD